MTTHPRTLPPPPAIARQRRARLAVTGLFVLIFAFSAVWNLLDPQGARADTVALGFPAYSVYPLAAAKLVGLAVILWGGSRTLTGFAFAGFIYDLLLALSAHIALRNAGRGALALFALVVTLAAWWADRRRSSAAAPL